MAATVIFVIFGAFVLLVGGGLLLGRGEKSEKPFSRENTMARVAGLVATIFGALIIIASVPAARKSLPETPRILASMFLGGCGMGALVAAVVMRRVVLKELGKESTSPKAPVDGQAVPDGQAGGTANAEDGDSAKAPVDGQAAPDGQAKEAEDAKGDKEGSEESAENEFVKDLYRDGLSSAIASGLFAQLMRKLPPKISAALVSLVFVALGAVCILNTINIWDRRFLHGVGQSINALETRVASVEGHIDAIGFGILGLLALGGLIYFVFFAGKRKWGQIAFMAAMVAGMTLGLYFSYS
jgi:hypothetical protein